MNTHSLVHIHKLCVLTVSLDSLHRNLHSLCSLRNTLLVAAATVVSWLCGGCVCCIYLDLGLATEDLHGRSYMYMTASTVLVLITTSR